MVRELSVLEAKIPTLELRKTSSINAWHRIKTFYLGLAKGSDVQTVLCSCSSLSTGELISENLEFKGKLPMGVLTYSFYS